MVSLELRAQIRRLHFAEHLSMGAIASHLNLHHATVKSIVLEQDFVSIRTGFRVHLIDDFVGFIEQTLETFPKITATRIYQMIATRGYKGSVKTLRRHLLQIRPRYKKAYLKLNFLAGEQAQVDWASFGTMTIGSRTHKLSCFAYVLAHSRYLFAYFTFDQTLESFLRCHVRAFSHSGGIPRKILYDNLKAAVLERLDHSIRFNPSLLALADHYRFEPVACNVRAGNEKGRVERSIRYIRDSFFCARKFKDLADANHQLRQWLDEVALSRAWVENPKLKIVDVWKQERSILMALPDREYLICHTRPVRSGKTPYITFEANQYSIPYKYVGQLLTLIADDKEVKILSEMEEVAKHDRSFDQRQTIFNPIHVDGLLDQRPKGKKNQGQARLLAAAPASENLLNQLADNGYGVGGNISKMLVLLEQYGEKAFAIAIEEAVSRKTPQARSVAFLLNRNANRIKKEPIPTVELPKDIRIQNQIISASDLKQYDQLSQSEPS